MEPRHRWRARHRQLLEQQPRAGTQRPRHHQHQQACEGRRPRRQERTPIQLHGHQPAAGYLAEIRELAAQRHSPERQEQARNGASDRYDYPLHGVDPQKRYRPDTAAPRQRRIPLPPLHQVRHHHRHVEEDRHAHDRQQQQDGHAREEAPPLDRADGRRDPARPHHHLRHHLPHVLGEGVDAGGRLAHGPRANLVLVQLGEPHGVDQCSGVRTVHDRYEVVEVHEQSNRGVVRVHSHAVGRRLEQGCGVEVHLGFGPELPAGVGRLDNARNDGRDPRIDLDHRRQRHRVSHPDSEPLSSRAGYDRLDQGAARPLRYAPPIEFALSQRGVLVQPRQRLQVAPQEYLPAPLVGQLAPGNPHEKGAAPHVGRVARVGRRQVTLRRPCHGFFRRRHRALGERDVRRENVRAQELPADAADGRPEGQLLQGVQVRRPCRRDRRRQDDAGEDPQQKAPVVNQPLEDQTSHWLCRYVTRPNPCTMGRSEKSLTLSCKR